MIATAAKVRDAEEAAIWRARQGGSVVFTNGVFDLIHPGHVELLEAARREGDCLIVGLNTDNSVRRLGKGLDRPISNEAARARVMAGFAAVDCVVLFDGDTPLDLIQRLKPDVLVKGADYSREGIVGADFVESGGGRVVRVPLLSGYSTTSLVERLRASLR
ncbi:MAG TPA: D-glycero-beta-D-manno-heptose 1-phosphate adenylyltransferase [Gemmatimonadales bacterium]|jgi:D-beta-D-heptose 7-phosphate kinase/D-beta-D-heptose 1-phosphate adenosyltransferase|nr:D-glycero-beta-D-manno-heptose 1-phosphate adenylyltransferase [Gemmatimonadales bacterium]